MKTKLYNLISNYYKRFKRLASDDAQVLKVVANKGYQSTIILLIISFAIISPNIAKAQYQYMEVATTSRAYALLSGINIGLLIICIILFVFLSTYVFNHFSSKDKKKTII